MDRFEEIRQSIIDRTGTSAWGTDARKACDLLSGEMLKASDLNEREGYVTQAVLVFETKYGAKPGLRTVILTGDNGGELRLTMNMFSAHDKTPVVTPAIERFRKADVTVAIELPKWYRLVDNQGNIIADDMTERWARTSAAAMSEFGVRLVEMVGSSPARTDDDKEVVS